MNGSEKDRDDGARHASRPHSESELFCRGSDPEGGETIEDPDGITNEYFEPDVEVQELTDLDRPQTNTHLSGIILEPTPTELSMNSAEARPGSMSTDNVMVQVKPSADTKDSDEESELDFSGDLGESLPSHQFRSLRGLPSDNKFKRKMRRTLKNRDQVASRGSLHGSQSGEDQEDGISEISNENDLFQSMNFTPEEYAELMHRGRSIKEMPTSIRRKRSLHSLICNTSKDIHMNELLMILDQEQTSQDSNRLETLVTEGAARVNVKKISNWMHFKLSFAMRWQHFKDWLGELLYSLELWRSDMKEIQGHFGSGVLSYFIFLRWLFLLNLVVMVLTVFLLFIPQIVFSPSFHANNATFTGWEFLTGEGWFTKTELYYGTYTNRSIPVTPVTAPYSMPLAYLCVGGGYLLLCLAILVYSMASSYRENYIYSGDEFSFYVTKVFCAWDHGIEDESAAKLKKKSIYNDFKEILSEHEYKEDRTLGEKSCLIGLRMVTNLLVIGLLGGSAYLIYYCSELSLKQSASVISKLLLPLVVSGLNLLLPFVFRIIASLESYEKPRTSLKISLTRTIVLKLSSLAVVLVSLYFDVNKCRKGSDDRGHSSDDERDCDPLIKKCWENYIGFAFYRLTIVDFIFLLLSTFFGEFLRRVIAVNLGCCKDLGPPGFDISRNVLDLIYGQSLCWIGVFYSPLLSVICMIKLLILFYVKKVSVMQNCRPSMRPFRASRMNLLFLVLLGIAFVVALVAIGYTVMTKEVMTPSAGCGPFRGNQYMFEAITSKIATFPEWFREAVEILTSAGFLAVIFCILGITVYYYKMLKNSNEKKIKLLKDQIAMAGRDKMFLLRRIKESEVKKRPHQD